MNALLEKFNSIDVEPSSLISAKDRQFVDKTQEQFLALVENLNRWKNELTSLAATIGESDYYTLKKETRSRKKDDHYFTVSEDHHNNRTKGIWTDKMMFSPAHSLLYIEETLVETVNKRNRQIISYFNSSYNLRMDSNLAEDVKVIDAVISLIIESNDGKSLTEAGTQIVMEEFKSKFGNGSLSKNKITFPCVWFGEYSKEYSNYSKSVRALISAISFFESGSATVLTGVSNFFQDLYSGELHESDSCEKFSAIRFYKNNKCELHFKSDELATEFFEQFQLNG